MSEIPYHFSPDLLKRVVEAIFLLTRSKEDVFSLFRNCGIREEEFADALKTFRADPKGTKKVWIAQTVVERLNASEGDRYLGYRRALLQRIVDWEDFSLCWPDKRLEAQGAVSVIRDLINRKDSFTRIAQAEERERQARAAVGRAKAEAEATRREALARIAKEMAALWSMTDAHKRGATIERLLNELFAVEGISVRESSRVVGDRGEGVVEQIDGVIEIDGRLFLVEVKWHSSPLGVGEVSAHLVRVFGRAEAAGLVISASGFGDPAVAMCREALRDRVVVLAELSELLLAAERSEPLVEVLRAKVLGAVLDKNPFVRTGTS